MTTRSAGPVAAPEASPRCRIRGPRLALGAVSVLFAAVQLALSPFGRFFLNRDEAIYLSQVTPGVPALDMAIHRTRGMSLLVAPVAPWADSPAVLRTYMAVLVAAGLYLAFRPWVRTLGWAAPVAAFLFAGHFVTLFFGQQLYPNVVTAVAVVAVVGHVARHLADGARVDLVALVPWVALASLVRPLDTVLVTVALSVVLLLVSRRAVLAVVLAFAIGGLSGFAPWLVEGMVRFDLAPWETPFAAEDSGADGVDHENNGLAYLENSDGPVRCVRDCPDQTVQDGLDMRVRERLIFVGLTAAAVLALADDPRRLRTRVLFLPAGGLGALLAYYLTCNCAINWRYLVPAVGMVALLAGAGIVRGWGLVGRLPWRLGDVLRAVAVVCLVLWAAYQGSLAHDHFRTGAGSRERAHILAELIRERADGEPCAVAAAVSDRQIQYYSGCPTVSLHQGDAGRVQNLVGGTTSIHDLQLLHEAGYEVYAVARPGHIQDSSPVWDWEVEDITSETLGEYRLFHAPDGLELDTVYQEGYSPEEAGPP